MKRARRACLTGILGSFLIAFLACNSPTEPSSGHWLGVATGSFGTVDGSATILECHQLIDGKNIYTDDVFSRFPTPVSRVDVTIDVLGKKSGHHTLVFRVDRQTQSPTTYKTTGIEVRLYDRPTLFGVYTVLARVNLPDQTITLRTGEELSIGFDI